MEERDVIIVGGGPAGLSAGIYSALDKWRTTIFEGNWIGGQLSIAYTVLNYPGFLPGDGEELTEKMRKQVENLGVEIRGENVTFIDPDKKIVRTEGGEYQTPAIILACGARMQKLGAKGEDKFIGKGVSYYAKRDYKNFEGKRVLVVGGGNSTAKSAILSKTVAKDVIMIHRQEYLRTYPRMTDLLQKTGVNVMYNTELLEIRGSDHVEEVVLVNNKTKEKKTVPVDWVVICVGTSPNLDLAKEMGLKIENNHVWVDEKFMTSKQGIFACGDMIGKPFHVINAAAEGASAGMAASEYLAMELVKRGIMFAGAKNGKYAYEYGEMLKRGGSYGGSKRS